MSNIIPGYTPLKQADFSIINQSSATVTDYTNGVYLTAPTASSNFNCTLLVKAAPTAPYAFTAHMKRFGPDGDQCYGIVVRNSSSQYFTAFTVWENSSGAMSENYHIDQYYSPTNRYAIAAGAANVAYAPEWWRIVDNNTNRYYQYSRDGINWFSLYNEARTTFVTPNQIGFFVCPYNTTSAILVDHFRAEYSDG